MPYFGKDSEQVFVKGRRFGRPVTDVAFTICMSIFETFILVAGCNINAQQTFSTAAFLKAGKIHLMILLLISLFM